MLNGTTTTNWFSETTPPFHSPDLRLSGDEKGTLVGLILENKATKAKGKGRDDGRMGKRKKEH